LHRLLGGGLYPLQLRFQLLDLLLGSVDCAIFAGNSSLKPLSLLLPRGNVLLACDALQLRLLEVALQLLFRRNHLISTFL
jgi:hypothetical protein